MHFIDNIKASKTKKYQKYTYTIQYKYYAFHSKSNSAFEVIEDQCWQKIYVILSPVNGV